MSQCEHTGGRYSVEVCYRCMVERLRDENAELSARVAQDEALIRKIWDADAEHPCSGTCLGCGAGPDEGCIPPCRCDVGENCAAAARLNELREA